MIWWTVIGIALLVGIITILIIAFCLKEGNSDKSDEYGPKPSFFSPTDEKRGLEGERIVNYYLKRLLKEGEYLLKGLLLSPKRDRNQIDTILITRKGLFSIETKFWVGHIIGDDYSDIWYQKYDDPYKPDKPRKNPVKQNNVHCEIVERELNEKYIAFNYVVFASETDLTSLSSCHTYLLSDFLSHYMGLPDILCEEDIEKIYQKLYPYEATEEEMKLFKKQINARYGK